MKIHLKFNLMKNYFKNFAIFIKIHNNIMMDMNILVFQLNSDTIT